MRKSIILFFILLTFSSCKTLQIDTSYGLKIISEDVKKVEQKISISAIIMDSSNKEKTHLTYIAVRAIDKNNNIKENPKEIKIISEGKEYLVNVDSKYNTIYPVHSNGIIIDSDEFILELGKIKFEDGSTLNIPPLLFKRFVYIYKINRILDALNQNTREDLFSGTIEEYREWKKKNK